MKTEVKIPKGWRKLRSSEIVRDGDKFFHPSDSTWKKTTNPGLNAGWGTLLLSPLIYIRRRKAKKGSRRAK